MAEGVALLIADMQKDVRLIQGGDAYFTRMVDTAGRLIAWARAAKVPIIYSVIGFRPDYLNAGPGHQEILKKHQVLQEGTPGCEVVDELTPQKGDFIVRRRRVSCFYNTELDLILRTLKTRTLVLTGISTNHCVESTAREAADRDLRVVVVSDGCAAATPGLHESALKSIADFFGQVMTGEEAMKALS